jgi:hypothetical protein
MRRGIVPASIPCEWIIATARLRAIERLLDYFSNAPKTHLRIEPQDIGEQQVGHFAFFRSAYQATLWPIALTWLHTGELASDTPGRHLPRS